MSEEYKSVCDKCERRTWYDIEQQCHCVYNKLKTCEHCGHSEKLDKQERCTGTLRIIDNSDLDSRFDYAYKEKRRVEVVYNDGTKSRFWVGKSTGWKPRYLEIKTRRSIGGSSIYAPKDAKINILKEQRL